MRYLWIVLLTAACLAAAAPARVGDIAKTIDTPGPCPTGLACDGRDLWLADSSTDMIYQIDPQTGQVRKSFDSPGRWPEGLAWDGKYLWHIDSGEKLLYQLDPADGTAVKVLPACTDNPRDIAWDGKYLWITDHKKDVIMKVLTSDGMAAEAFAAPGTEVTGIEFDGKYLWVADRADDRIYLVNPSDGICISSLRSCGPVPAGCAWGGDGLLWNVDYQNRQIYAVKVFDDDILTRWEKHPLSLHFVKEFCNYGPGLVKTANIYLPLPTQRDNQQLLSEPVFDTEPARLINDKWGQKMAVFSFKDIKAGDRVRCGWTIDTDVYCAEYFIYPDRVKDIDAIPDEIKKLYLSDGDKYALDDETIKTLANKIADGQKNPYWVARRVTEYLTEHLSYNLKPIGGWNPAPMVLKRGTASCSEYSCCMIALCRAAGVPARYVGAVSLRGDDGGFDDVFHRWVEVYLPPYGWIPFDANKADAPLPGQRVLGVGNIAARYVITTANGGADDYLRYSYNYGQDWTSDGKCHISEEAYGLWSARGPKKYNKPEQQKIE